jgi:iron complex outermembrane receptor protein
MNRFLAAVRAAAWASLGCSLLGAPAVSRAAPPLATLPEVRVTGSALPPREARDDDTAQPVIVLRQADIARSGATTVAELLQQLPAMQGAVPLSAVSGNETRGYAGVSLHDLGDGYTLVLLNGRRVAPFAGQTPNGALSGVDLNTIPLAMVARIEVLSDGGSALYGADAIGGVVNIVTRPTADDDAPVNEAETGWTWPRGGAREWRASAYTQVGSLDAEGGERLAIGAAILHRDALRATARDGAHDSQVDFTHDGQRYRYLDFNSYAAPGNVYDDYAGGNPALASTGQCPAGTYSWYDFFCLYNYAADLDLVPEQNQQSLMASYSRRIGPDGHLRVDALWSQSRVISHLSPASTTLSVAAGSALYADYASTFGITGDPAYVDTRFVDLGRRHYTDDSQLADLALTLDGRHAGWQWQGTASRSESTQRTDLGNAMGAQAAQRLVDTDTGYDPRAWPGQQSATGLAALRAAAYNGEWLHGRSTQHELQWQAATHLQDLPGGPLQWAVGANVRHEQLAFRPSPFARGELGDLRLGEALPLQTSTASRLVWGVFSEWQAPVRPTLDLGLGVRADHDPLAGSALTGRASARWQATATQRWRVSVGTGFRAPTLNQLRAPTQTYGQTSEAYACTPALQARAVAVGATPCTLGDPDTTYTVLTGGNAHLQPEHSVQGNLGWRIEPLHGHTVGIDLWSVYVRHRIATLDEGVVFDHPEAYPDAWAAVPASGGGSTLALASRPLNAGSLLSTGIDVDTHVRRAARWGLVDSQLRVTGILREQARVYAGGPWVSNIGDGQHGAATLKWRALWRNSLTVGRWAHTLTARWQSGYLDAAIDAERLDDQGQPTGVTDSLRLKTPPQLLWDWQTRWQPDARVQVQLGIVNLFDTRPPLSLNTSGPYKAYIVGYDERYHDVRGRMWTLAARLSF